MNMHLCGIKTIPIKIQRKMIACKNEMIFTGGRCDIPPTYLICSLGLS